MTYCFLNEYSLLDLTHWFICNAIFLQFLLEDECESEEDDVEEKKSIKDRTSKKRLSYNKGEYDEDESVQFKVRMFVQVSD